MESVLVVLNDHPAMTGWAPLRKHCFGLRSECTGLCCLVHVHEVHRFGPPCSPSLAPPAARQALALACHGLESISSPSPP